MASEPISALASAFRGASDPRPPDDEHSVVGFGGQRSGAASGRRAAARRERPAHCRRRASSATSSAVATKGGGVEVKQRRSGGAHKRSKQRRSKGAGLRSYDGTRRTKARGHDRAKTEWWRTNFGNWVKFTLPQPRQKKVVVPGGADMDIDDRAVVTRNATGGHEDSVVQPSQAGHKPGVSGAARAPAGQSLMALGDAGSLAQSEAAAWDAGAAQGAELGREQQINGQLSRQLELVEHENEELKLLLQAAAEHASKGSDTDPVEWRTPQLTAELDKAGAGLRAMVKAAERLRDSVARM